MKKLFLASSFWNVVNEFLEFLGVSPHGLMVAFVPTAADPYEDKWFVESDRKALTDIGFRIQEIDLKGKTEKELRKEFKKINIIFVAGGNTFYLLKEVRKSGFDKVVKYLINKGLVYIGSSAGAYILCPTIEAATWKHHDRNHFGLTDFTALNLVPFLITAHFKPEYTDIVKEAIPRSQYPVKILTDQQALTVLNKKISLVGREKEIKIKGCLTSACKQCN